MSINTLLFGTQGDGNAPSGQYIKNAQLYKKAYMIEFYNGDRAGSPDAVFTFSLPPESEELTYTPRKTETKTFGGLHVDDYGMDAVKITLSGSTVNQSLKKIYQSGKVEKWLSGEEEVYYFRDLLLTYRSLEYLKEHPNSRIYLTDLSKYSWQTTQFGIAKPLNASYIKNQWEAYPGEFKIRRSSDKPFTYRYTVEFTGITSDYAINVKDHAPLPELNPGIPGLLQKLMQGLLEVLSFVDGITGMVNNVLDKINQVSELLRVLGNVMTYSVKMLTGIIDSVGESAAGLLYGASSVIEGVNAIVSMPRTIQLKALNVGLEMQNATNALMRSTADLSGTLRGMFTKSGEYFAIPEETLDQYALNNEEFKDLVSRTLNQLENKTNELAAAAKSADIPDVYVGNPDPLTQEPRIVLVFGFIYLNVKATDTLESLAAEYLGDPDLAIIIASYNNMLSLNDLEPGDRILMPVLTQEKRAENNLIFARREDRDNYGRDIALTLEGEIMVSHSGDYALTEGASNLSQAILLRLRESVAKRIRLTSYGIKTAIGDPVAGVAYIVSSINKTVSSDPRVASVDDIRFSGEGDHLNVTVSYSDINHAQGVAAGKA